MRLIVIDQVDKPPERWSPEFRQYVKLDPNLTRKDLSHGYPT